MTRPARRLVRPSDQRRWQAIVADMSEGVILLAADRRILWVNDAALRLHGVDKATALGATVNAYRQRFRHRSHAGHWIAARDHPIERLLRGETFDDVVVETVKRRPVQNPNAPRRIHRLRGLAMDNGHGATEAAVLVISDITEEVEAEERFERAFEANPAPALICRLDTRSYVKVNRGFLELTGFAANEVLRHTLSSVDPFNASPRRAEAIRLLAAWETIPQIEAELAQRTGGTRLVVVAGQPIEYGDRRCMLLTFADLEPHRRARLALRDSEERFATAFRLAPVPMLVCDDQPVILEANEAFAALVGGDVADVLGASLADLPLWEDGATRKRLVAGFAAGRLRAAEARIVSAHAGLRDCLVSAEPVTIGGRRCTLAAFQDITARKHTEQQLRDAIQAVMQDASWFSGRIVAQLAGLRDEFADDVAGGGALAGAELTHREREILGLIAQGRSDAAIADQLGVSRNTVRNHVARIYAKLGVHRRGEAIVWARERGIAGHRKLRKQRSGPSRSRPDG